MTKCIITSLTISNDGPGTEIYIIGANAATYGLPTITQAPLCGYVETKTSSGEPSPTAFSASTGWSVTSSTLADDSNGAQTVTF